MRVKDTNAVCRCMVVIGEERGEAACAGAKEGSIKRDSSGSERIEEKHAVFFG